MTFSFVFYLKPIFSQIKGIRKLLRMPFRKAHIKKKDATQESKCTDKEEQKSSSLTGYSRPGSNRRAGQGPRAPQACQGEKKQASPAGPAAPQRLSERKPVTGKQHQKPSFKKIYSWQLKE